MAGSWVSEASARKVPVTTPHRYIRTPAHAPIRAYALAERRTIATPPHHPPDRGCAASVFGNRIRLPNSYQIGTGYLPGTR